MKYLLLITIIFSHLVFANKHTEKPDLINKKSPHSLQKRADGGDRDAQHALAMLHHYEFGIPINFEQAFKYYQLAAEQNHIQAQYELAMFYFNGFEVSKNYKLAIKYFTLAAKQNHLRAQYMLAMLYRHGIGTVPINPELALYWYRQAAKQDHRYVQQTLAMAYRYGFGVKKNLELAEEYYRIVAEQSHQYTKIEADNLNPKQRFPFMSKIATLLEKQESKTLEQGLEKLFINKNIKIVKKIIIKCQDLFRKKYSTIFE